MLASLVAAALFAVVIAARASGITAAQLLDRALRLPPPEAIGGAIGAVVAVTVYRLGRSRSADEP